MANLLQFFQKNRTRLWGILLVLVWTFFLAKTANVLIGFYYFPYQLPERAQSAEGVSIDTPDVSIRTIISRNLFNSEAKSDIPEVPEVRDNQEIVPSSLPLELLGTIVFDDSKYSVALVRKRQGKNSSYYGIGESILGATIVRVERFSVILENQGRLERLEIQAAKANLPERRPQRPSTPSPRVNPSQSEDVEFTEIGPGRFEVPQTYLDGVLKNFSSVLTQARMVPNIVDGNRTDGFRIFQIKPNSIFEKLGLRNNDVIKQVNGVQLDSFEKATGLYTALRNEKSISIDVVRDGSRLNYTYEIR